MAVGVDVSVIGVGVAGSVLVGAGVAVVVGWDVKVGVQVGGRLKTTSVGVAVGNSSTAGIVAGGNGLIDEPGLVKMIRNPPATQTTPSKASTVMIIQKMPDRLFGGGESL